MRERFYVSTVTGYLTASVRSTTVPEGLSAMVLDRARVHRVVAIYRSEEMPRVLSGVKGWVSIEVKRELAIGAAEARCAELNARHAAR